MSTADANHAKEGRRLIVEITQLLLNAGSNGCAEEALTYILSTRIPLGLTELFFRISGTPDLHLSR